MSLKAQLGNLGFVNLTLADVALFAALPLALRRIRSPGRAVWISLLLYGAFAAVFSLTMLFNTGMFQAGEGVRLAFALLLLVRVPLGVALALALLSGEQGRTWLIGTLAAAFTVQLLFGYYTFAQIAGGNLEVLSARGWRIHGTTGFPSSTAFLMLSAFAVVWLATRRSFWERSGAFLMLGMAFLGVLSTGSRTPFAAALVALTVVYFSSRLVLGIAAAGGVVGALYASVAGATSGPLYLARKLLERLFSVQDALASSSFQSRLELWNRGLELFSERPLIGWGPGRNDTHTPLTILGNKIGNALDFHNWLIELLVMGGLLLALPYLLFLAFQGLLVFAVRDLESPAWFRVAGFSVLMMIAASLTTAPVMVGSKSALLFGIAVGWFNWEASRG